MKKVIVLFVSLIAISVHMKANVTNPPKDVKKPYVSWKTAVPADPKRTEVITWFLAAMQGQQTIPGAKVNSTKDSYVAAWGPDVYEKVLSADPDQFELTFSKGGETNWGLDSNNRAVAVGTLAAGIPTISIAGVELAKWGSNGCLNALSPFILKEPTGTETKTVIVHDTTRVGTGSGPITITINNMNSNTNTNTNSNTNTTAPATSGSTMGYATTGPTIQYTSQPQPQVQYTSFQPEQQMTAPGFSSCYNCGVQQVKIKPNALDYLNTAANLANATANVKNAFWGFDVNLRGWKNPGNGFSGGGNGGNTGGGPIHIGN